MEYQIPIYAKPSGVVPCLGEAGDNVECSEMAMIAILELRRLPAGSVRVAGDATFQWEENRVVCYLGSRSGYALLPDRDHPWPRFRE